MPDEEISALPVASRAFGRMGTAFEKLHMPVLLLCFFSFPLLLFLFLSRGPR